MPEGWALPQALDGERLDRALAVLTGCTRRQAGELIDAGRVRVDAQVVLSRARKVRAGTRMSISGSLEPATAAGPTPDGTVAVPVVWSDDQVIVIDKPAGLVVHPGAGHRSGTLVHGLLARFPDLASQTEGSPHVGERDRPGIVHRLDQGTSGLLMVARTGQARAALTAQLAARRVGREYAALVAGTVDADSGLVDAPLGRDTHDPTRIRVQAGGRPARTRYWVEQRYDGPTAATLLRCRLETGRTHQIRVHLASIGHPVVGDERYGGRDRSRWRPLPLGRLFLHAATLTFDHPVSGERLSFSSLLPADLLEVRDSLSARPGDSLPGR